MNNYLQVPRKISLSTFSFLERNNIDYEIIHERDVPDELPGYVDFLGKEYECERLVTFKLNIDAEPIKKMIEEAVKAGTL